MFVGLLVVDCTVGEGHSLKEKRRILQSLFAHLRAEFNVSVTEVEHQDLWQRAKIAICSVNTDGRNGQSTMSKIEELLSRDQRISVIDSETIRLC